MVLLFTIGINLPYWIACQLLGLLPIGWFSLESLLAGLVVLFLSRRLGAVLLLCFFAEDLLLAVSRTYYLTPLDCLRHLRSLSAFAPLRLAEMAAAVVLAILFFGVICYYPRRFGRSRREKMVAAAGIVLFGCLGVAVDSLSIRSTMGRFAALRLTTRAGDENRFTHYGSLWFFRYATLRLKTSQTIFAYTKADQAAHPLSYYARMSSASATALSQIGDLSPGLRVQPSIVLVVVESWGRFEDPKMRALFNNIYSGPELSSTYDVQFGEVPFHGSTVNEETRALCGVDIGFDVERAPADELSGCLPTKLKALGYHTVAVHGMGGQLFLRRDWYQNMGFEDIWFRERLRQAGLADCVGAFRGICDDAIAGWMTGQLNASPQPQFFHWMTLNSHLPLPASSGLKNPASCAPLENVTAPFCFWYQFVVKVHQSVAAMAEAVTRPTVFIVVGDHAPPFSNEDVREQFSQQDVPYVLLLPKTMVKNRTVTLKK